MTEPKVILATVREVRSLTILSDERCWDIECRFDNGEKFAAVQVDYRFETLAHFIADRLNDKARIDAALAEIRSGKADPCLDEEGNPY